MAKQTVNIGSSANDRTGDNLRTAFNKLNTNFDEIYLSVDSLTSQVAAIQSGGSSNSGSGNTIVGDLQGSVIAEDSTVLVDGVGGAIDAGNLTGTLPAIDGSALTDVAAVTSTTTVFTARADVNLLMGEVVYLTGISGNTPTIDKAQANSASTMPAFGIVKADVTTNNTVEVITFGSCPGHDVANFGETGITFGLGDTVYVSATEAGKLTNVAPAGESNLIQNIGKIERATPTTNMTIKVGGAGRTNATPALDEGNIFIGNAQNRSSTISFATAMSTYGGALTGDVTGSVFADDSTVLVDGVNGTLNSSALTKPIALADNEKITFGDGDDLEIFHNGTANYIAGAGGTILTGNWLYLRKSGSAENYLVCKGDGTVEIYYDNVKKLETTTDGVAVTGKITGLTDPTNAQDAATKAYVDANSGGGAETDPIVGAITGIVKADGAGNISAAVAGTDYSTFDGAFGSLTGTPTTISGYGITDALTAGGALTGSSLEAVAVGAGVADGNNLTITGGDATEINSTGGDANITGGSGALASGNVNIGTTQTVAIAIGASGVGTSIGGTLTANGNAIFNTGVQEKFATLTGSTGVTAMDCDNGQVFYLTGAAGDITANFTNLGLTAEYGTNVTVIINQGATPYEVTAVQIGGSGQTIEWQGGLAPTGNANGIDSFSFTILRDGGSYVVLGQMVDFT